MARAKFINIPEDEFKKYQVMYEAGTASLREIATMIWKAHNWAFSPETIRKFITNPELYKYKSPREVRKDTLSSQKAAITAKVKVDVINKEKKEIKKAEISKSDHTVELKRDQLYSYQVSFKPNEGPQTDFLSAPETDVLYGGAAGGGKSMAMIVDPLRYCHKSRHKALILRRTLKELRQLIDLSREYYPLAYPGAKYKESEKVWFFPSGARIEFGYLEKDADVYQYQGQDFTWIGFDEITQLPTEFPWHYLSSRLRTPDPEIECYMRCTANPGGPGSSWVKERYISPTVPGDSFVGKDGISRRFIPSTLKDNPYLYSDGRYQRMLESLPEIQRKQLLEGNWDVTDNQAFPDFNKNIHVIQPFKIPNSWQRMRGVDYGYRSPSAVVWVAFDPSDGTMIVYRELYRKELTGEGLGKAICDAEMEEVRQVTGVVDYAVFNKTGYAGPTIGEILNKPPYSLKLRSADKNRHSGKVQIHERLRVTEQGRPKLQIFSSCVNLIRELSSLETDKNDPEDVDTHMSDHAYDALRYVCMSRPTTSSFYDRLHTLKRENYVMVDPRFGY